MSNEKSSFSSSYQAACCLHLFLILHDRFSVVCFHQASHFYQSFTSSCLHRYVDTRYRPTINTRRWSPVCRSARPNFSQQLIILGLPWPKVADVRGPISRVQLVMGLSSSEDRMIIAWVVLRWYQAVRDRQTDGETDRIYHSYTVQRSGGLYKWVVYTYGRSQFVELESSGAVKSYEIDPAPPDDADAVHYKLRLQVNLRTQHDTTEPLQSLLTSTWHTISAVARHWGSLCFNRKCSGHAVARPDLSAKDWEPFWVWAASPSPL